MTTTIIDPVEEAFRLPPLVTAEDFAAWTEGKIAKTDPRLDALLRGASAGVRRWCNWHIAPVLEETFVLDGPGARTALLPTANLVDVLEVIDAGRTLDPARLDRSRHGMIELAHGARFTDRLGQLVVRVRHGHDLADVDDVAQIIKQTVANALASPMGATREQAGTVSISWATTAPGVSGGLSLLERDYALLAPFRIGGM